MALGVLWHPPLLAHKALPSTLVLLSTAPATRLSHQRTNWNVLYQETLFLKKSNLQAPLPGFPGDWEGISNCSEAIRIFKLAIS